MDTLLALLFVGSLLAAVVLLIIAIIFVTMKKRSKPLFIGSGASFALFIVSVVAIINFVDSEENPVTQSSEPAVAQAEESDDVEEETEEERKEREEKEKQEEEDRLKKEEEERQKAEEELEEKRSNAETIEYAHLEKNPDRYAGEYTKYTGEILQIQEDATSSIIRLAVTETSYGYSANDVVYVEYPGITDFITDDIVTVYGEIYGSHSYTSQAGWEITVPALIADKVE